MENHKDAKNTLRRLNLQRNAVKRNMIASTTGYIRDKAFRKAMIEIGRSETNDCRDGQACERRPQLHSQQGRNRVLPWQNWWIHSNLARVDSIPTRYEPEFKSALSTMQRLKRAEDKKKQEALAQTSSSSSFLAMAFKLVGV